jgi:CubicO group peptidase (beta-lactamase class C family)
LDSVHFPSSAESRLLPEYQNGKTQYTDFDNNDAAGGLVSNANDLKKFVRHLFIEKDVLLQKQYLELTTFINLPEKYYSFTGVSSPKFGLGVFEWNIKPFGNVISYPGVLKEGFTSNYIVVNNNVIIVQSNTYNRNDFTLLWPYHSFIKSVMSSTSA